MTPQIEPKTEKVLTLAFDELLKQIDAFPTLDEWWAAKVVSPTMKIELPQFIALIVVEILILYTHDWIAAFLCAVIMLSKAYQTIVMLSVNKLQAYLVLQIRDSFTKGMEAGKLTTDNTSTEPII